MRENTDDMTFIRLKMHININCILIDQIKPVNFHHEYEIAVMAAFIHSMHILKIHMQFFRHLYIVCICIHHVKKKS